MSVNRTTKKITVQFEMNLYGSDEDSHQVRIEQAFDTLLHHPEVGMGQEIAHGLIRVVEDLVNGEGNHIYVYADIKDIKEVKESV